MEYETTREKILERLNESFRRKTLIGIYAPDVFGPGIFITIVEKVLPHNDTLLVRLKEFESVEFKLPRRDITIQDITKVFSFHSPFNHSFLKLLTGITLHTN